MPVQGGSRHTGGCREVRHGRSWRLLQQPPAGLDDAIPRAARISALDGHFRAGSQTKALPNLYGTRPRSPGAVRGGFPAKVPGTVVFETAGGESEVT